MLYRICKRMIQRGQTAGLAEKLDIFFAADRPDSGPVPGADPAGQAVS